MLKLLEYMKSPTAPITSPLFCLDASSNGWSSRSLPNKTKLILTDEPTASLHAVRGKRVTELLKKIAEENQSAEIVVTHDERLIASFDRVYHLKNGCFELDIAAGVSRLIRPKR